MSQHAFMPIHGKSLTIAFQWILIMFIPLFPSFAVAQSCPGGGAALVEVRNAINNLGKNNRSPAAADCGYAWALGVKLDQESMMDPIVISFFIEVSDLHRRAAEKRFSESHDKVADGYLSREISLRKKFVEQALRMDAEINDFLPLRRATVKHISALTGALALRKQYAEIDEMLSNIRSGVVDTEAVNAWLQAISSCDKFDGNPDINLCVVEKKNECREKISVFLSSVDEMKAIEFPPRTRREIASLRHLSGEGGCLNE